MNPDTAPAGCTHPATVTTGAVRWCPECRARWRVDQPGPLPPIEVACRNGHRSAIDAINSDLPHVCTYCNTLIQVDRDTVRRPVAHE